MVAAERDTPGTREKTCAKPMAAEGVQVYYLCATRGDVGEVDAALLTRNGHATAADLRTQELMCAARALGLAGVEFLDYRDSGMSGSPENQHPASLYQSARH